MKRAKYFLLAAALIPGAAGAFLLGAGTSAPVFARAEASVHTWSHSDPPDSAVDLNSTVVDSQGALSNNYYYLSDNLDLQSLQVGQLTVEGNVELCLNGFTLTLNDTIEVGQDAQFTLHDCQVGGNGQEGSIVGPQSDCAVYVTNGGNFTMEGGTITGAQGDPYNNFGAVTVSSATFTMNGGSISDNQCIGVFLQTGATFTMNGGGIEYNAAKGSYPGGGIATGAQASDSSPCVITITDGMITGNTGCGISGQCPTQITMSGGMVMDNYADTGNGGGINLQGGKGENASSFLNLSGTAKIQSNYATNGGGIYISGSSEDRDYDLTISDSVEIAYNTASGDGGGVYVGQGVRAQMTNGLIGGRVTADFGVSPSGNTSEGNGGGVYVSGGSFTMSGGTIGYLSDGSVPLQGEPGNTAKLGGGVYVGENATFTLENDGVIGYAITAEQYQAGIEDESQKFPYGNWATNDYNSGGGGVCIYGDGAKFIMTGDSISYITDSDREAAGVYVNNDPNIMPETVATFEFSGGKISYHPDYGVQLAHGGTLKMSNAAEVFANGTGVYVGASGILEMSGGAVSDNMDGIVMRSELGNFANAVITGGTVTQNETGVSGGYGGNVSGYITLGGDPVIKNNGSTGDDGNNYPQNLLLGINTVTLLPDFSGDVGISLSQNNGAPFTSGFQQGMETCFTLDGLMQGGEDGIRISVKETEVYDETTGAYKTVTELALTYHLSFMDGDRELFADDSIAGGSIYNLLYTNEGSVEAPQWALKPEIETLLVKDPDAEYHYAFSEFRDEAGNPYDFENQIYIVEKNAVITVVFAGEAHSYPDDWTQGEMSHTKTCTRCAYVESGEHQWGDWQSLDGELHAHSCLDCGAEETAQHAWSAWVDSEDGENHTRTCTDGCGAEETAQHTWSTWTDSGETHYHVCTEEGCTAREEEAHTYPAQWSQKDDTSHSKLCEDCQHELTANHTWSAWVDSEDGENHMRTCTDGCGAEETAQHAWGTWTDSGDGENHTRTCTDGCGAEETAQHTWSAWTDSGETHYRVCKEEGCTAREEGAHTYPAQWSQKDDTSHSKLCEDCQHELTANHTWGNWTSDGNETHSRTCSSCTAKQTANHTWGSWSSDGDETHSRTCSGCTAKQTANHTWGSWTSDGDETHSRTCSGCTAKQTANHTWGSWSSDGDETHSRTCSGCTAKQTANHNWSDWAEGERETLTRDCGDCLAHGVKSDERPVFAVLLRDGNYIPCRTLQSAFDTAETGETVYLVRSAGGTEISSALVIGKSVLLTVVTRSVDENFRAVYTATEETVLWKRAPSYTGTMILVAAGARIRFENLVIEGGEGTAVEVYGSLTVAGGKIDGTCAIRVCAPETQGIALLALEKDASLSVTGTPVLGTIRLDDPAGAVVPAVDFTGFTGSATVEISDSRPYGAFATGLGSGAVLTVSGGPNDQNGLSCREVRAENGMALCGGYDLIAEQTALGEVVLSGQCDEYRTSLEITVNGQPVTLAARAGAFEAQTCNTGSENYANISVGGAAVSFGLVYFDEQTGLLTAPEGATYSTTGTDHPLDGADPFVLALGRDTATVTVDGKPRTFDLSRPVGTAFVYRYLTEEGVLFTSVDFSNYQRIQAGENVFREMTSRQQSVVNEKLADTPFRSFEELLDAVNAYLAAQNQKTDEFLQGNDALSKDFAGVTGQDRDALNSALEEYLEADEEERYFLDETAKQEGYSGFEGMIGDLLAKSEFEAERNETLENLGTILRGCDGKEVRQEFSLTIETVEGAVYERCTDDDLRLDYLIGRKEALATAVRVLENIRAEERAKNAFDAYLLEKQQSGCYSEEGLEELTEITDALKDELSAIDPEAPTEARRSGTS